MIIAFARTARRKRSRMGEGARRADEGSFLTSIFKCHQYRVTHRIARRERIRVADAQYPPSLPFQRPGTRCIVAKLGFAAVCCAINFDNQLGGAAGKVREVGSEGKLPYELEAIEPAVAQFLPQAALGFGFIFAK